MRAAVYTEYGPPEVLHVKEVERPVPRDNEILIKIHATTVNRTDCGFRKPAYPLIIRPTQGLFRPRKTILGTELAGDVESVGKEVRSFAEGDRVFGLSGSNFGTHAEYVCIPESGAIATMPVNMSYTEAAAVCDGLMLGWNYMRQIDFGKARKILIYGASGSIGTACLQLAKHFGATVTAVCNTKNIEIVRALGADRVIDYTTEDFTQDEQRYDVVMDAVGKISYFRCRRLLKPGGTYFSTDLGFLGQNVFLPMLTPIFSTKRVKFPLPKADKKDILFFKELIEAGRYRAVIDRCYHLEQIVEATRYVETEQKTGNVVVSLEK